MKDLVIIGAGGFARETAWLVEDINQHKKEWNLLGFIDDNAERKGEILNNYPILDTITAFFEEHTNFFVVCAVGDPRLRKTLIGKTAKYMPKYASLIHPNVRIAKNNSIGDGCIICAGNLITVNITISYHVIINLDCTIGHDTVIGSFSTLAPSVNISGNVTIGEGCNLGTNSAVIQGISIGEWTVVGAGAVVINNLPPCCTAVGVPAKAIKQNKDGRVD